MGSEDISLKDIMTKQVISVSPETPLSEAASLLSKHNFSGMPVVDADNTLVGILTDYDLISKDSLIHLPTFQKILQNLSVYKKDKSEFQEEVKKVSALKVKDVMNREPLTLLEDASFEETVAAFRDHHRVNPIPVIDSNKKVIGVVSRYDLIKPLEKLTK